MNESNPAASVTAALDLEPLRYRAERGARMGVHAAEDMLVLIAEIERLRRLRAAGDGRERGILGPAVSRQGFERFLESAPSLGRTSSPLALDELRQIFAAGVSFAESCTRAAGDEHGPGWVRISDEEARRFDTALNSALNALSGFALLNGGTTDNDGFRALAELRTRISAEGSR